MNEIFSVRFNTSVVCFFTDHKSRKSEIIIKDAKTLKILHERIIYIWSPLNKYDYFFRTSFIDTDKNVYKSSLIDNVPKDLMFIFMTSYDGLFVWDACLKQVLYKPIQSAQKYKDVFGFDIIDSIIYVWSVNQVEKELEKRFQKEYGKRYRFLNKKYDEIIENVHNESKKHGAETLFEIWDSYKEFSKIRDELYELNCKKNKDLYQCAKNIPTEYIIDKIPSPN